jgi:hypothetical protein
MFDVVVEHSRLFGWLATHLECIVDVRKYFTVNSNLDALNYSALRATQHIVINKYTT